MKFSIRLLYLYLFSFIGLLVAVIGSVRLIQLALKVFVFNGADTYNVYTSPVAPAPVTPDGKVPAVQTQTEIEAQRKINDAENQKQRQREVAEASAMIIVGAPLYLYHWKKIQKENKK
jgi:hypothetical protein